MKAAFVALSLWAVWDLPADDPRRHGLSALAWDQQAGVLYALADHPPTIVEIRPERGFKHFRLGRTVARLPEEIDGEGLALGPRGFLVADETGHVYEVSRRGRILGERPLPAHFAHAHYNRGIESLGTTADRRWAFVTSENALEGDGARPTPEAGTTVRLLRLDVRGGAAAEFPYLTEPLAGAGGEMGVCDIVALSPGRLLVTERGFLPGTGNSVRIYRVDLDGATSVLARADLGGVAPVAKTLVVDFATLSDDGLPPPPAPQPNRLLDNFEGVTLGPRLPDGRRLLFAVSDDNRHGDQTARLLVIAVPGL